MSTKTAAVPAVASLSAAIGTTHLLEGVQLPDGRYALVFTPLDAADAPVSKSGKTRIVATSNGTLRLPGGLSVTATVFTKA